MGPGAWVLECGSGVWVWRVGLARGSGAWVPARGSRHVGPVLARGSGTWNLARGSWPVGLARGSWHVGPGTWILARGSWHVGPGAWVLSWPVGPGPWVLAHSPRVSRPSPTRSAEGGSLRCLSQSRRDVAVAATMCRRRLVGPEGEDTASPWLSSGEQCCRRHVRLPVTWHRSLCPPHIVLTERRYPGHPPGH